MTLKAVKKLHNHSEHSSAALGGKPASDQVPFSTTVTPLLTASEVSVASFDSVRETEKRGPFRLRGDGCAIVKDGASNDSQTEAVERHLASSPGAASAGDDQQSVGVVVRVRPLSAMERDDPLARSCVQCLKQMVIVTGRGADSAPLGSSISDSNILSRRSLRSRQDQQTPVSRSKRVTATTRPSQFRVDQVHHPHSTQVEVYEQSCRHIVQGVFSGVNGSILAYGATGSGKTHTMFGGNASTAGVVYQAVQDIFREKARLEEDEVGQQVSIKCSFIEIYNEGVFDLLVAPQSKQQQRARSPQAAVVKWVNGRAALQVRETGKSACSEDVNPEGLHIGGLTYVYPDTMQDFVRSVEMGHAHRFVAATGANAQSSRSHAIITVEVRVQNTDGSGNGSATVARIRFCDLAGSERAAATSNTGARLREGGNINRSLLALAAVVQSLAKQQQNPSVPVFIPYRGSKLTRLLRDGIGGNCRTQMLFCLSPNILHVEETLHTMLFASHAKVIQVAAKRNVYSVSSAQVSRSQEEVIEELRMELAAARAMLARMGGSLRKDSESSGFSSGGATTSRIPSHVPDSQPGHGSLLLTPPSRGASLPGIDANVAFHNSHPSLEAGAPAVSAQCQRPPSSSDARRPTRAAAASNATSLLPEQRPVWTPAFTPAYTDLETRISAVIAEKESLCQCMRDAMGRQRDAEVRLRKQKWTLARLLTSGGARGTDCTEAVASRGGPDTTSACVSGVRNLIAQMEAEGRTHSEDVAELQRKLDGLDRRINHARQDLLLEQHHPSLALLVDNADLRYNCMAAESLAASYHFDWRAAVGRQDEFAKALETCVTAIQSALPHLPAGSPGLLAARQALLFSQLPEAKTEEMTAVMDATLRDDGMLTQGRPVTVGTSFSRSRSGNEAPASLPPKPGTPSVRRAIDLEAHYLELVEKASTLMSTTAGDSQLRGHRGSRNSSPQKCGLSPRSAPSLPPLVTSVPAGEREGRDGGAEKQNLSRSPHHITPLNVAQLVSGGQSPSKAAVEEASQSASRPDRGRRRRQRAPASQRLIPSHGAQPAPTAAATTVAGRPSKGTEESTVAFRRVQTGGSVLQGHLRRSCGDSSASREVFGSSAPSSSSSLSMVGPRRLMRSQTALTRGSEDAESAAVRSTVISPGDARPRGAHSPTQQGRQQQSRRRQCADVPPIPPLGHSNGKPPSAHITQTTTYVKREGGVGAAPPLCGARAAAVSLSNPRYLRGKYHKYRPPPLSEVSSMTADDRIREDADRGSGNSFADGVVVSPFSSRGFTPISS